MTGRTLGNLLLAAAVLLPTAVAAQEVNAITKVAVTGNAQKSVVVVTGTRRPTFQAYMQKAPVRVVLDLVKSSLQGVPPQTMASGGLISEIRTSQLGTPGRELARLEIIFAHEIDYQVDTDGTALKLTAVRRPGSAAPAVAAVSPEAQPVASAPPPPSPGPDDTSAEQAEAARKQEAEQQAQAEAKAAEEKKAQELAAVEQARKEAEQKLAAEKAEQQAQAEAKAAAQKEAQELAAAEEARKQAEQKLAADKAAQKAQQEQAAAHKAEQLAAEQRKAKEQEQARAEQARQAALAQKEKEAAQARAREDAAEQQRLAKMRSRVASAEREPDRNAGSAADAPPPSAEDDPDYGEERGAPMASRQAQASGGSAAEEDGSGGGGATPRVMTFVGFKNSGETSQVVVRTNDKVTFNVRKIGQNRVAVELDNCRITLRNNMRPLDTSFFPRTAIRMITPEQQEGSQRSVRLVVELSEEVTFESKQDGNTITVSFQRPAG